MLSNAPVALRCTRMSFDLASLVSGCRAPDRAILDLLSSCVARLVMHPTALHCTSTLGEFICLIKGARPPSATMATLFSAVAVSRGSGDARLWERTVDGQVAQGGACGTLHLNVWVLEQEQDGLEGLAVDFPDICMAGVSGRRGAAGAQRKVAVPLSVISAKVKLADLCKSMLSEYTRVLNALRGAPEKKSVSARCSGSVGAGRGHEGSDGQTDVFQEAEQVGHSFPLAVGQDWIVDGVFGASWRGRLAMGVDGRRLRAGSSPPQQVAKSLEAKLDSPMAGSVAGGQPVLGGARR